MLSLCLVAVDFCLTVFFLFWLLLLQPSVLKCSVFARVFTPWAGQREVELDWGREDTQRSALDRATPSAQSCCLKM